MSNPYQYNDKEQLDEDAGLGWLDYGFRQYDPQIGRFVQQDPLTWDYEILTPYQFAANDPIANIDVDGLEAVPANVLSFVKSLGDGAGAAIRPITTGMDAGGWAVSWTTGNIAHAMIFKAVPIINKTVDVTGMALNAASALNKLATKPPTGNGDGMAGLPSGNCSKGWS
jgi:RHS repeat-associated protein